MIGHDAPTVITIANVRDLPPPSEWEPWVVYVGRVAPRKGLKASPLGNPYGVSDYGLLVALRNYGSDIMHATQSRDARQKEYADVRAELARLRALAVEHGRLTLVCWCETWDGTGEAPGMCHAEIIRKWLEARP